MTTITSSNSKYGITERKKAELDALTTQVTDAQYLVNERQAVVDSLTLKSAEFTGFLNNALAQKDTALTNLNLVEDVVNTITNLMGNVAIAAAQTSAADIRIANTAENVNIMVNQLIFCADLVDKLNTLITKKKALNPLISDELVSVMSQATSDANDAVAVSLTALQSCYAAMASSSEAMDITLVESAQTYELLQLITGETDNEKGFVKAVELAQQQMSALSDKIAEVVKKETEMASALQDWQSAKEAHKLKQEEENAAKEAIAQAQKAINDATTAQKEASYLSEGQDREAAENAANNQRQTAEKSYDDAMKSLSSAQSNLITANEKMQTSQKAIAQAQANLKEAVGQMRDDNNAFMATTDAQQDTSLQTLLTGGYAIAVIRYNQALRANNRVTTELDEATASLDRAQAKLASLEAGLSAATAAAMAA